VLSWSVVLCGDSGLWFRAVVPGGDPGRWSWRGGLGRRTPRDPGQRGVECRAQSITDTLQGPSPRQTP